MRKILLFCVISSLYSSAQQTNELWSGIGIQRKINSNLSVTLDINNRVYSYKEQLFYPELTFKYKVKKWFKPSIDYRGLIQLNKYENYKFTNRLNFNFNFEKLIKKLTLGFRIRYQYAFNGIRATENYSPEFDQSIRLKPSVKYDIKKSRFSPSTSIEWFYNPQNGSTGDRFSKIRASIGTDISLPGPHTMSISYLYGQNINGTKEKAQNIISVYYSYILGGKKKKD